MMRTLALVLSQLIFCYVSFAILNRDLAFAQAPSGGANDSFPSGKTLIEAEIATNWIERGLTQTDSAPSIHAAIGYKWTQFKVGMWGSNFRASPGEDSMNLRLFSAYKFIITSNLDVTGRLDLSNYFSAGTANGNIISVDVNIYTYHVDLEQVSNWEGTGENLMRFAFRKDFIFGGSWVWGMKLGYNSPAATTVVGYLDFLTSFGYKLSDMRIDLAASLTSQADQLNARGKPAVYLLFSVMPE